MHGASRGISSSWYSPSPPLSSSPPSHFKTFCLFYPFFSLLIFILIQIGSNLLQLALTFQNGSKLAEARAPMLYIFPLPRNAFPREGTGVKTDFFFREKVSLSAVVGKKDGCLTDWSSCLPERSEGRQRREVRQSRVAQNQ